MKTTSLVSVFITLTVAMAMSVVGLTLTAVPASATGGDDNTNSASYWEGKYSGSTCYKDEGTYGTITNGGNAVTLKTLGGSLYYSVLIVKGGAVDTGDGSGNVVYTSPVAGKAYFAPKNDGGQQAAVSHWIVCTAEKVIPGQPQALTGTVTGTDAVCTVPSDGTAIASTWQQGWTQGYVWNESSWSWILGSKVYGGKVVTHTETVPAASCNPGEKVGEWSEWTTFTPTCADPSGTETRTRTTTTYVWNPETRAWVGTDKITTESRSVTLTDAEFSAQCAGANPGPKVGEWSEWTTFTPTCADPSGTEIRTRTTTTYVWNPETRAWVGTETVASESRPVTMTDADFFRQCAPVMPTKDLLVVPGEYGGAVPTCTMPSVEWTRTITTTTYSYVWNTQTRSWDMVTSAPVVTTDPVTQTHALTTDQVNACSLNLQLTKTVTSVGPYYAESNVTYQLVPHNDGPATATAGWSVTEVLPAGATLVGMSGDGYMCTGLVCVSSTTLAAGTDGKPITVVAKIPAGETVSFKNVAYVSPSEAEVPETNPLVVPTTETDTVTSGTDNDAQAIVTVLPPETEGISITVPDTTGNAISVTLPNTGTTIPLTWLLAAMGILAAGVILLGASRFTSGGRKK